MMLYLMARLDQACLFKRVMPNFGPRIEGPQSERGWSLKCDKDCRVFLDVLCRFCDNTGNAGLK